MDKQTYLFEKEPIRSATIKLCIPTICSNIVMIVYSLADTYFVGFLNSAIQSAAVSLCSPILLLFNVVNNLFGVGASSLLSRALGEKDSQKAWQASAVGFWGALVFGCIFALLSYLFLEQICILIGTTQEALEVTSSYFFWAVCLGAPFSILNVVLAFLVRAEGRALQASIGTMSGCFLNILLDPLFILVFGMGAEGAALATALSNMFAVGYFLVFLFLLKGKSNVRISPKYINLSRAIVLPIIVVGLPAAIQNMLNVLSQILMNNLAAGYGTDAIAAVGISFRIAQVLVFISIGVSQGIQPIIGYTYSAKLFARMKESIYFTIKASAAILLSLMVLMFVFSHGIVGLFIDIPEVIEMGAVLLKGMCVAMPFLAIDFIGVVTFQAVGNGMVSLLLAFFRKILTEIPLLFLFNYVFGLYGLGFSQMVSEMLTSTLSMILLFRFLKTLPNVNITQKEENRAEDESHSCPRGGQQAPAAA